MASAAGSPAGAGSGVAGTAASASGTASSASASGTASAAAGRGSSAPDLGRPTTFLLLRHGETALTGEKRFSGSGGSDPALSETGLVQAARAAEALAVRGRVDAVISSPLTRCRETAAAAASRLGLDVSVEEDLRETAFGDWDGLTFAEVRTRFPGQMDAWLASPAVAPPGGESFEDVSARVERCRDDLLAAHRGRTVLLVSHVTPIKTLVRLALGAPQETLFRMYLGPASLSEVAFYGDGNASLRCFNEEVHLRGDLPRG